MTSAGRGKRKPNRLHLDRAGVGEVAQLDGLLALGRLEEDQLGAARRLVAADLLETEDFLVELHRPLEVVQPVTGVEQFGDAHGGGTIARERSGAKAGRIIS